MTSNEIAIAEEHGHPGEPCKYLGLDMWDCGHCDNEDEEKDVEECPRCHTLCNGDVTIADHGCCIDCHHNVLNGCTCGRDNCNGDDCGEGQDE